MHFVADVWFDGCMKAIARLVQIGIKPVVHIPVQREIIMLTERWGSQQEQGGNKYHWSTQKQFKLHIGVGVSYVNILNYDQFQGEGNR